MDASFRGHTEPGEWSFLQPTWPTTGSVSAHFAADGVHAGVLQWLSEVPARPLQSFQGESYSNVIIGLPSLRFFLQTPEMSCHQVSAVSASLSAPFRTLSSFLSEAPRATVRATLFSLLCYRGWGPDPGASV